MGYKNTTVRYRLNNLYNLFDEISCSERLLLVRKNNRIWRKLSQYKRFTLIELLMIVAIIAILAGLLLPSLKNAKEAGRQTACKSNLRQMSLAFITYANDYNNYIPPYWIQYTYYGGTGGATNYSVLGYSGGTNQGYLGECASVKSEWRAWFDPATQYMYYKKFAGCYSCPSATINKKYGMDYGENAYIGNAAEKTYAGNTTAKLTFTKYLKVQNPTKIFLLSDANTYVAASPLEDLDDEPGENYVHYRHNGSLNLIFLDLHVESHKRYLANPPATYGPAYPWM